MRFVDIDHGIVINAEKDPYQKNVIFKPDYAVFNPETFCFEPADLVEVDDLMALPIILLNKIGYKTKYCCSGHDYEFACGGYIVFEDEIFKDDTILNLYIPYLDMKLKDVPFIEIENNNTIRYVSENEIFEQDAIEVYQEVLQFNKFILAFTALLPDKTKEGSMNNNIGDIKK